MKKNWIVILVSALSIVLMMCVIIKENNAGYAKVEIGGSSLYSEKEIKSAIKVVKKKFKDYPAILVKVWYEENLKENEEWAKTYEAEEAIVLHSSFKTYSGKKTINQGLNPNNYYSKWDWILVRDGKNTWELKTAGQG